MTTPTRPLLSAALLTLALTVAGCGSSSTRDHDMGSMATPTAVSSPSAASTATAAAGAHNDADVMFATRMIPHHQQAVEMSEVLLSKDGIHPEVRDLATRIKAAQSPEIAQLSSWLTGWGANPSPSGMGGMSHGGDDGMMSATEMDASRRASGPAAQKMFLTGMIAHHQGAVRMAQTELDQGQHPDARQLARSIVSSQTAEIEEMQQLLDG